MHVELPTDQLVLVGAALLVLGAGLARRLGLKAESDLIPTGASTLEPGDRLIVFGAAHPDLAAAVRAWVTDPGSVSSFR